MEEQEETRDQGSMPTPNESAADFSGEDRAPWARKMRARDSTTKEFNETVRRAKQEIARTGTMPCGVGFNVYGYNYKPKLRHREVQEEEAAIILRIFNEYVGGRSPYSIARGLNAKGTPPKRGRKWRAAVILNILRNDSYTGIDHYGKTRTVWVPGSGATKVHAPKSEWIKIVTFTPPLIDRELFERAQQRLSLPKRRLSR